jgi:amidase
MAVSRRDLMAGAGALGALAACNGAEAPQGRAAPTGDALGDLDATGVAARIRSGAISAPEAMEAAIARTQRVNPTLNFIAAPLYDMGRARAAGPLSGPFAGVPTLIKDLLPLAGAPLRYGSRAFATNVAPAQPPYVDALLAAGLVPFGKSTTPEFGLTATTEPLLGGPTRNPWNPDHSTGGSSGGAAAAVASGAIPIAHASDGGGSIRIPASCCGLFGLKPSRDRAIVSGAPDRGISISVNGCLSRSVRDTAAWLAATERSGAEAAYPAVGFVAGPSERRLRIGLAIPDLLGREPDPEVRAAIEGVAALCRSLGHTVRDFAPPIDGASFETAFLTLWAAGAAEVADQVAHAAPNVPIGQLLEPLTLDLAAQFRAAPAGSFEAAIAQLQRVETQYQAMFSGIDVLLTPVLSKPPPPIGELAPTLPLDVGFARVRAYASYTPLQNAAGAPAMSVPMAWSASGLPIGAHFAAAKGEERRLLELAYELELARPWAGRRPPVWAG